MKGKEKKLFKNPSAESLQQGDKQIDALASSIDCNTQKPSRKSKYASYSLSESILFNNK
ncbi:hypothetical protein NEMIN01_2121 [Nematocida minor]|uniref:uncharacterized protein n=1 Tax=Nematocida minor TaxID=1912983 RepID=UPI002220A181|nr:uncharacterized protein NEMIN01_2121 [Nematocida minor]KAI5192633.1 hypothetical protein NEMIN01_2121 [Nematocida minor]